MAVNKQQSFNTHQNLVDPIHGTMNNPADAIHGTMNTPADPYKAVEPVLDGCYIHLLFLIDVVCPGTFVLFSVEVTNLLTMWLDGSSQSPKTVTSCSILSEQ